jgi:hypothetical protein
MDSKDYTLPEVKFQDVIYLENRCFINDFMITILPAINRRNFI